MNNKFIIISDSYLFFRRIEAAKIEGRILKPMLNGRMPLFTNGQVGKTKADIKRLIPGQA